MPRIILDTDPGIDDALALCLALASPEIQLDAVTTVNGNVDVSLTTSNALALLDLLGQPDLPVARGCDRPLLTSIVEAAHVHGENGLGGVVLPKGKNQPVSQHAVSLIIERVLASPKEITLVAIGPLTNLALAVRLEPRIAHLVHEVVIMGGALQVPGNVTPNAEFNFFADPYAAQIVLHAGWPIRLVSLDVTTRTTLNQTAITTLAQATGPVQAFISQALQGYFSRISLHSQPLFQMHDPLCLAAAFLPDLISWQPAYVEIELSNPSTLGQSTAYLSPRQLPAPPNVLASLTADSARFCSLFVDRINQTYH